MSINLVSGNKSTVRALLNHLQFMYNSIDLGNFVISVLLDFKRAFDTVDHEILLSKLDFYELDEFHRMA